MVIFSTLCFAVQLFVYDICASLHVPVYTAVTLVCLIWSFVSIERPISSFLVWQRPLLPTPRKKLDPASDRLKIVHPFNFFFFFLTMKSEVVMTVSNIRYLKCFDI